jgi:hypothetical protein
MENASVDLGKVADQGASTGLACAGDQPEDGTGNNYSLM